MVEKTGESAKSQNKPQFDITEFLAVVWRRKWLIIVPLILITAVALAGTYLMIPEYRAFTIISVGNPVKLSVELRRLLGEAGQGYRTERDRQLELNSLQNEITSSPFIKLLVEELKLDQDPDLHQEAQKKQASSRNLTLDQIKFDILLNRLRDKININYVGNDQIRITIESTTPELARDMAKSLTEIFISEKMKQERGILRASDEFTYEQLARYENDLQDRIQEKTDFEIEFNKIKLDDLVASDENRKEINSEISSVRREIEEFKDDERRLLNALSDIPAKNLTLDQSNKLKELKRDIDGHIGSISNLMLRYTWSAPEILNYKARLFSLVSEIADENRVLVNRQFDSYDEGVRERIVELFNVRSELDILYDRVNSLQLALDNLNAKIDLIPEYQARLDQLEREITAGRDLRDKFKEQQESSQISQALLRESKYKVIEPAKIPMAPFKPKRAQIVILGFLLGLAVGGAAALLVEILDKSFRKIEDVEEALGLPIMGVVPRIESVKKVKIKSK